MYRKERNRKCFQSCIGKNFVEATMGLIERREEVLSDLLKKVREWKGMGRDL